MIALHSPSASRCLVTALLLGCLIGCGGESTGSAGGGGDGGGSTGGAGGTGGGGGSAKHALRASVMLMDDGQGVNLFAQNGAEVHVPAADIAGKTVWWATTPGGEPVSASIPLDFGSALMKQDLTAEVVTPASYGDGPWELSLFVSIAGKDPADGPQAGDLGAFDNSPPPAGQPPVTGSSVRMTVDGADASVGLGNDSFVQF